MEESNRKKKKATLIILMLAWGYIMDVSAKTRHKLKLEKVKFRSASSVGVPEWKGCFWEHEEFSFDYPKCYGICRTKAGNGTFGTFSFLMDQDGVHKDPKRFPVTGGADVFSQKLCELRNFKWSRTRDTGPLIRIEFKNWEDCSQILLWETGADDNSCNKGAFRNCELVYRDNLCVNRVWKCKGQPIFLRSEEGQEIGDFAWDRTSWPGGDPPVSGLCCKSSRVVQRRFNTRGGYCNVLTSEGPTFCETNLCITEHPAVLIQSTDPEQYIIAKDLAQIPLPIKEDGEGNFIGILAAFVAGILLLAISSGGLGLGIYDEIQIKSIESAIKNMELGLNKEITEVESCLNTDRRSFKALVDVTAVNTMAIQNIIIADRIDHLAENSTLGCKLLERAGVEVTYLDKENKTCEFHFDEGKLLEELLKVNITEVVLPRLNVTNFNGGSGEIGVQTWVTLVAGVVGISCLVSFMVTAAMNRR